MADTAASVLARLKNKGTETGQQIGKKDAVQGVGGKKISQP